MDATVSNGDAPTVRVRFAPSGRSVAVPFGTTLLEAARRAELPLARGCGAEGLCGRCGVRVLSGTVGAESDLERRAKERNRVASDLRLACRVPLDRDVEVTTTYW